MLNCASRDTPYFVKTELGKKPSRGVAVEELPFMSKMTTL